MSNVIKSHRVIKSKDSVLENKDIKGNSLYREILEEAKKIHDEIIFQAKRKSEDIINSAHTEYEKQLNIAYDKAKKIYEENKEKGYSEGYEVGNKEGYTDGYNKGYKEGKEEADKLIEEALDIKEYYINKKNQLLKETEEELIELVITIYEKVLYKKVEEDEEYIISLISKGLEELEIKDKLIIIVSKDDYEIVKRNEKNILARASLIDSIDIRVNSEMNKGDCILETSKGNIDVSLKSQLDEIKDLLSTILNNE